MPGETRARRLSPGRLPLPGGQGPAGILPRVRETTMRQVHSEAFMEVTASTRGESAVLALRPPRADPPGQWGRCPSNTLMLFCSHWAGRSDARLLEAAAGLVLAPGCRFFGRLHIRPDR